MLKIPTSLTLILLLLVARPAAAIETVTLYSYHDHPPFVTGPHAGLTEDLALYLNSLAPDHYRFVVKLLPRARLNAQLAGWINGDCTGQDCAANWLVAWVNPAWGFIKGNEDPYQWQPLFEDSNAIVSLRDRAFEYHAAESLDGRILLGMRGHHYVGIDDRVEQGRVKRIDGNDERDNLLKLLAERGDAALLPTSTIDYFLTHDARLAPLRARFFVSPTRHQRYTRFLMLPGTRGDLLQLVRDARLEQWARDAFDQR